MLEKALKRILMVVSPRIDSVSAGGLWETVDSLAVRFWAWAIVDERVWTVLRVAV